jgi:5-hydroxyisourate hydrolase
MSRITTHVLDVARGCPAEGVGVRLERGDEAGHWREIGRGDTDADGRLRTLLADDAALAPGQYRLTFDTGRYFGAQGVATLYPSVSVTIRTVAEQSHYHVPLLLSPFGYTTYRGS